MSATQGVYWHEKVEWQHRLEVLAVDAPRDPPHPAFPWVLGPENAPSAAPPIPDAVKRHFDEVERRLRAKPDDGKGDA